jgi:CheY-like chemotaxis protein
VDLFAHQHFDVVLMDVQMPVMDGLQAAQAMRRIESVSGCHTPIVALTAYASVEDRKRCRQAGMDDYLSKPFKAADLEAVLSRCCGELSRVLPSDAQTLEMCITAAPVLPVFDADDLLARIGGRSELIPRFLELFRNGVARQREELAAAVSSGDADAVRIAAHAVKGSAANISALRVHDIAANIEKNAIEGHINAAVAQIPNLHEELDRFDRCSREQFP